MTLKLYISPNSYNIFVEEEEEEERIFAEKGELKRILTRVEDGMQR